MKKVLFAFVAMALLFSACEKEGVFSPKQKISKIYMGEDKKILYDYVWNGKLLDHETIYNYDLLFDTKTTLTPVYDGKRVVCVNESDGTYALYTYDHRWLTGITWKLADGTTFSEGNVEHENNKISKIFTSGSSIENAEKANIKLAQRILPKEVSEKFVTAYKKMSSAKLWMDVIYTFEWQGDNVSKLTCDLIDPGDKNVFLTFVCEYEYDNKLNPTCCAWSELSNQNTMMNTMPVGLDMNFSKNNFTKVTCTTNAGSMGTDVTVSTYEYEYDGKYPVKRTCTSTNSIDAVDILYYEYE